MVAKKNAIRRGKTLAQRLRGEWELGNDLVRDIFILLEERGIDVVRWKMDSQLAGCVAPLPEIGPVLFINTDDAPLGRQAFTAAHELFHLEDESSRDSVLWEMKSDDDKPSEEISADAFAAEFLLPGPGLSEFMSEQGIVSRNITPEELVRLEIHLTVSHEFLVYRLHNLEHITANKRDELLDVQPVKLALEMGYDDSDVYGEEGPVFPKRYRAFTFEALEEGKISINKFKELLMIDDDRFRRYVEEMDLDVTPDVENEMMV